MKITGCLFLLWLAGVPSHGIAQQVALTFDDLASHGPLPPGLTRVAVAKSIIQTLRKAGAPKVYGFVNGKLVQDVPRDAEVLKLWTEAGFPLGNHTWSHVDLHTSSAEAFEKDVAANEAILRQFMPAGGWQWFRYPYLHEGETPQKKRAVMVSFR
jgi:peptidoglycan-N-acetylglucosamine deacetylase